MPVIAAEIMTSPAITVAPHASIGEIFALLAAKRISAVPVCGADGALAGIVSEADILRPVRESARAKRAEWLALLAEGEEMSQDFLDYLRLDTRAARDVMVRQVVTATEDMTLPELAELMVTKGVKHLPVLRGDQVVGVVSRADLVAAIARAPDLLV
jgi:CBS domain-containing protein